MTDGTTDGESKVRVPSARACKHAMADGATGRQACNRRWDHRRNTEHAMADGVADSEGAESTSGGASGEGGCWGEDEHRLELN